MALFDRAWAGKLGAEHLNLTLAALHLRPSIAAPALLATACASFRTREIVLARLKAENLIYRIELLCAAAASLRKTLLEGSTECDHSLVALASGATLQELGEQGKTLEVWSRSLKLERDVQGYTSWLVKNAFELPVNETIENPRKFDLPERIGIFTTRALTPFRETHGTSPDDGL